MRPLQRLRGLRFDAVELSGGLGDLGTFIPLAASLILECGLDGGTLLLFAGVFNIASGVFFGQPIPVQPMKAIAAVAIAEQLMPEEIAAAGFAAGLVVLFLGATNAITWIERHIPRPIVRGIQLGVGLKLAIRGLGMVTDLPWLGWDGLGLGLLLIFFVLLARRWQRVPTALLVFVVGVAVSVAMTPSLVGQLRFGWQGFAVIVPSAQQWTNGLLQGTVPQLPLTILNSVVAVCALSEDLFPRKGIKVRPMAMSVGLMNLVGCLFGAMPACHGSGGLAGQYRFGARTGGSVVMLGAAKIVLGLGLGTSVAMLLAHYPKSVLGVLLLFAGAELAMPARDSKTPQAFFVVLATAAGIIAVNTWVGFLCGVVVAIAGRKTGLSASSSAS